jgi:two-component system, OmpR family, sensor histidine kinase MprB
MSFRLRLTVLVSLAVAIAIAGTSFLVYVTYKHELYGQVDNQLSDATAQLPVPFAIAVQESGSVHRTLTRIYAKGSAVAKLLRNGSGQIVLPGSGQAFQVTIGPAGDVSGGVTTAVGAGKRFTATPPHFTNKVIKGVRSRVMTVSLAGKHIQVARSLQEVDRSLAHLRWLLLMISLAGIGVAALLGAFVSRRAVAPLRRLTETTERIVETGDLSQRVAPKGRDEISRLGSRLDELLGTLETSLRTQRQLVADASHELRTPIATLRANVELLARPGALERQEREELLVDVQEELEAMTTLVGELVELARGEEQDVAPSEFRLDEVVKTAVDRVARRAPTVAFRTSLEPSTVRGVPERVERAVANLLDNARKWSPAGGTVDVAVADGAVEVRDQGPGIADEDRPLVFNRFYRSAAARGMPGAGLGLAIVKQIADAHGGSIRVDSGPDGGAVLRLQLSSSR